MAETSAAPWYRLALTKRWISYLLLTVLFAVSCVGLGMWQIARRDEARQEITRVMQNYDSAPTAFNELFSGNIGFDDTLKWKPVALTGTYLPEKQVLVRSRPRQQQAGYEVLTPLRLNDGQVFIVDRGWLPVNSDAEMAPDIPAPPTGEVNVIARLKASEPGIPGRGISNGQFASIELPLLAQQLHLNVITQAYGLLVSESPTSAQTPPLSAIKPEVDEGPHLSYALQWILFAIMGFFGLGWAIRNEWKIKNSELPSEKNKAQARAQSRRLHPTEEDIEDALIDAAKR